jgi:asparagine synthase (glutamine-hydrolysing)
MALYWRPDSQYDPGCRSDGDYVERYREVLDSVVRKAARTHRPLSCDVSGGLDSSAVFATAERLRRTGLLPAPSLSGYTLSIRDDPGVDDLPFARAVGAHLSLPIQEVPPFEPQLTWYREWAAAYQDLPGYPNGVMSLSIFRAARDGGGRVHLSGVGGDELLAGGASALAEELSARSWRNVRSLRLADCEAFGRIQALGRFLRHGILPLVPDRHRRADRALRRAIWRRRTLEPADWLAPALHEALIARRFRVELPKGGRLGQRDLWCSLTSAFSAGGRERMELMAARVPVEIRHPLWATQMLQFAFSVPDRLRTRGGASRVLHRMAVQDRLPHVVWARETKSHFSRLVLTPLKARPAAQAVENVLRERAWVTRLGSELLFGQLLRMGTAAPAQWPLWGILCVGAVTETAPRFVGKSATLRNLGR